MPKSNALPRSRREQPAPRFGSEPEAQRLGSEPKAQRLKMKDLEHLTGVGREGIRFYIRAGLLPEPQRPARNVAFYDAAFVDRIRLIKKLQQERFLPLTVIKAILDGDQPLNDAEHHMIADLDGLEVDGRSAGEEIDALARRLDIPLGDLRELAETGAVRIERRGGRQVLEGNDILIAGVWSRMRKAGFSGELGFSPAVLTLQTELIDWLVREHVRIVTEQISGRVSPQKMREMVREGIECNKLVLPLLYENTVQRYIAESELPQNDDRRPKAPVERPKQKSRRA